MLTVSTTQFTVDKWYAQDQPIAVYFVFPELGLAIGLRPGDQLLFNLLYYHCISTKDFGFYDEKLFVTCFYIKTAIVGGNDNDQIIKEDLQKY